MTIQSRSPLRAVLSRAESGMRGATPCDFVVAALPGTTASDGGPEDLAAVDQPVAPIDNRPPDFAGLETAELLEYLAPSRIELQ